jgi:hypothetical protein
MLTCSLSWAAWEKTGTIVDGDEVSVYYFDKSTIRKNGVIVKMWIMVSPMRQNILVKRATNHARLRFGSAQIVTS